MIDLVFNGDLCKYAHDFGFKKIYSINDIKCVEGKEDGLNRRALESKKTDVLYGIEKFRIKDKIHYKDSGLNQVLCKLAKKNEIKIGFSFNDVLNVDGEKRATILGRMVQNVRLCNKYKVDVIFGSFAKNKYELRHYKDLIAFARLLGIKKIWNEKIETFFKDKDMGIRRIK